MQMNTYSGIMNTDSGKPGKSVHLEPEWVFTFGRNRCSDWTGIRITDHPMLSRLQCYKVVESDSIDTACPSYLLVHTWHSGGQRLWPTNAAKSWRCCLHRGYRRAHCGCQYTGRHRYTSLPGIHLARSGDAGLRVAEKLDRPKLLV